MKIKKEDLKITTLTDDIRHIVATAGQKRLDIMRFSKDHVDPYLMDDKKPVFSTIGQDQLLCIFDFSNNHFFLSPEQVYRFGEFYELDLHQVIALLLKSEWELFLAEFQGDLKKSSLDLKSIFQDRKIIEKSISDFHPDKTMIYNLIQRLPYGKEALKARSNVNLIVEDMIMEEFFLYDNCIISDFYPENESNENVLLKNASDQEVIQYKKLKYLWKRKTTELEEKLLEGEKVKRMNMNREDLYFRTFGSLELKKSALQYALKKYEKVLELKKKDPALNIKQALKKAVGQLTVIESKKRELKNTYMRSLRYVNSSLMGGGMGISHVELTNYKEEVKGILKKLFFLLHSDTCPVKNLSKDQKKGINTLWLELMSSKDELFSYTPDMLMWSLPDIDRLFSILKRACKILGLKVEDLEVADRLDLMIKKGLPIAEIIIFLDQDIEQLQLHLTNLEIVQDEYTNEKKSQGYRDALEDAENHKKVLKKKICELEDLVSAHKSNIKLVFRKVVVSNQNT